MRRPVRVWLIVETILCIPAILLGAFMAMMSPMMFDAPGSTSNPQVLLLFASVIGFPLACIVAVVSAWIVYRMGYDRAALWISLLPLVPVCTGLIALVAF